MEPKHALPRAVDAFEQVDLLLCVRPLAHALLPLGLRLRPRLLHELPQRQVRLLRGRQHHGPQLHRLLPSSPAIARHSAEPPRCYPCQHFDTTCWTDRVALHRMEGSAERGERSIPAG
uniref:Uncharacterized protein n=1 Tax=Arundo donax TaxID=35708 RepID=A0A0A9EEM4_ARUDO